MFVVHQSNRTEELIAALAEVLAEPLPDPLQPEIIAVQSLGMRTWLSQQLARRLGIWANGRFPFPRELIQDLVAGALDEPVPDPDPFRQASVTWAVMAELTELLGRPDFEPLRAYLEVDGGPLKRIGLARQIARVFDQYLVYRPTMVLGWEAGQDTGWQPALWRGVVRRLAGEPESAVHVARRCMRYHDRIRLGQASPGAFPQRLSLFGVTTLPPLYLEVLNRLPEEVAVHLFLFAPTQHFFGHIQDPAEIARLAAGAREDPDRLEESLHLDQGHPLLASLGRQGREFQLLLQQQVDYVDGPDLFAQPDPTRPQSALGRLQADIFRLGQPSPDTPPVDESAEPSIEIHACHSPMREVEVLHEQLRRLFEADGAGPAGGRLQPGDVIVMTPDIEAYAPLIEAVFGQASGGPPIPFSISDRSPRSRAPVVRAFAALLDLLSGRLMASEVFDLLALEPVRERFSMSMPEVELAQGWAREAGVRWGIDPEHRRSLGQEPFADYTWRGGLDRLLLGYAWPSDGLTLFGGCLPLDVLEGQSADVAGRWLDFCSSLFDLVGQAGRERPWPDWAALLETWLQAMLAENRDNAHQHRVLRDILVELGETARQAGFMQPIPFEVVRASLMERFDEVRSDRGFLSGGVTFCNLVPMRSIPFEVVCLLGMNDGRFPRRDHRLGFDLMAAKPRLGDRSARVDDRYLFLEALLSARRKLLVTYVGQSLQDNSALPPSVVVSELMDVLEKTGQATGLAWIQHPLQAFSPRYFQTDGPHDLISYQPDHFDGARALLAPKRPAAPFLQGPLEEPDELEEPMATLRLEDLRRFFRQPAAYLLERVLGVRLRDDAIRLEGREPIELDALQRHGVGQRVLDLMKQGQGPEHVRTLLGASGLLPPGELGRQQIEKVCEMAEPVWQAWRGLDLGSPLAPAQVDLDLGHVRLEGLLEDLWSRAQARIDFGRADGRRLLAAWIDHLVLCQLARGDLPELTHLVVRTEALTFSRPESDPALLLQDLVRLFQIGTRAALPLFPKTSFAFAQAFRLAGSDAAARPAALGKARSTYETGYQRPGEGEEAAVYRLFAGTDPLTDDGGQDELGFTRLARRVFDPLLDALHDGGGR